MWTKYHQNKKLYHGTKKIAHFKSFPSMYNTCCPNRLEVGEKISWSKKIASKWHFWLTTFSHHPISGSCHNQTWHRAIVFKVIHCSSMIFSFKMSYLEAFRTLKLLSYWHFNKMCCLPLKLSTNAYFFIKVLIVIRKK